MTSAEVPDLGLELKVDVSSSQPEKKIENEAKTNTGKGSQLGACWSIMRKNPFS